eukprot:45927-Pyramimonas_sp.AAC.1
MTEEARKRNEEAEEERISKRLQYNDDQTSWNHAAPGMPLEIFGESLVVCNWIQRFVSVYDGCVCGDDCCDSERILRTVHIHA